MPVGHRCAATLQSKIGSLTHLLGPPCLAPAFRASNEAQSNRVATPKCPECRRPGQKLPEACQTLEADGIQHSWLVRFPCLLGLWLKKSKTLYPGRVLLRILFEADLTRFKSQSFTVPCRPMLPRSAGCRRRGGALSPLFEFRPRGSISSTLFHV